MRIGKGYDVHRLVSGRKLFLGGVEIPFEKGLLGHSDADVLLHAICDALLGAAALGDIGQHFPDTDPAFKGVSSVELLKMTCDKISEKGFNIINIDSVIQAERPKMSPHMEKMRSVISKTLCIYPDQVNVKATTTEGLGMVGREEGIAAECVVLIERK